jgi:hypothetical protein
VQCGIRAGAQREQLDWSSAANEVKQLIEKSEEYTSALNGINDCFPELQSSTDLLTRFVECTIYRQFDESSFKRAQESRFVDSFIDELSGRPVSSRAKVELSGLALEMDEIRLAESILLRRPTIEDLERPQPTFCDFDPSFTFHCVDHDSVPSAILEIECSVREPVELQQEVEKAVAILRLFNVGSVRWISYKMHSLGVDTHISGTLINAKGPKARDVYLVTSAEAEKLSRFWAHWRYLLPHSFFAFDSVNSDHLSIAYKRYSDALMDPFPFERRVMTVMMGLEALFLEEKQELAYRMRMRTGKCLSMVGFEPLKVKKTLADAYDVRSRYAHGSTLDSKAKLRLESEYGEVNALLNAVLDYLRVSILVSLSYTGKKKKFLQLLDNSLIDERSHDELKKVLENCETASRY